LPADVARERPLLGAAKDHRDGKRQPRLERARELSLLRERQRGEAARTCDAQHPLAVDDRDDAVPALLVHLEAPRPVAGQRFGDRLVDVQETPRMRVARSAAFLALSTPTQATGTPGGICTIESSASSPSSTDFCERSGTPITGRSVCAAATPGRAAASPAPQIRTLSPRSRAERQYSAT